jgi:hypothetical protein
MTYEEELFDINYMGQIIDNKKVNEVPKYNYVSYELQPNNLNIDQLKNMLLNYIKIIFNLKIMLLN